ncbi:protein of unknown function [Blastococcus saxobsidens DD2]|uniref:Uncharacterized protein n=1 Tax=Blastococcus saxobsidens (strain DD2) TaxID=1146883 RepID=H6RTT6_BLASD|nr:protein of unknown function [Blastococcus saxobsidens DD2]
MRGIDGSVSVRSRFRTGHRFELTPSVCWITLLALR